MFTRLTFVVSFSFFYFFSRSHSLSLSDQHRFPCFDAMPRLACLRLHHLHHQGLHSSISSASLEQCLSALLHSHATVLTELDLDGFAPRDITACQQALASFRILQHAPSTLFAKMSDLAAALSLRVVPPSLAHLQCYEGDDVTPVVDALSWLSQLTRLELFSIRLTTNIVDLAKALASCSKLSALEIGGWNGVDDACVISALGASPSARTPLACNLRSLNLLTACCTDRGIAHVGLATALTDLTLRWVESAHVRGLTSLHALSVLQVRARLVVVWCVVRFLFFVGRTCLYFTVFLSFYLFARLFSIL